MGGMSGKLFGSNQGIRDYDKEYQAMETLVVPAILEQNFTLGDGSCGCPVQEAIQLNMDEISNLYRLQDDEFQLAFQERGVAYNEEGTTVQKAEVSFKIQGASPPSFSLKVDPTPVVMWGINFAGKVVVTHNGGQERFIYLPGTRTYDPAGITGQLELRNSINKAGPNPSLVRVLS